MSSSPDVLYTSGSSVLGVLGLVVHTQHWVYVCMDKSCQSLGKGPHVKGMLGQSKVVDHIVKCHSVRLKQLDIPVVGQTLRFGTPAWLPHMESVYKVKDELLDPVFLKKPLPTSYPDAKNAVFCPHLGCWSTRFAYTKRQVPRTLFKH
jgi:hypothetical protein